MKSLFGAAYDKLSNLYTGVQTYFKPQQKPIQNKLLKQIQACCYQKQKISLIHQAIQKVIKEYPQLQSGLLIFSEDMVQKSLIQLQGNLSIQYKSKFYPVRAKVYIPQKYPQQPPMVRIINTDPQNYKTNPVYLKGMSSNDSSSYVLVELDAFKNWNPEYLDICSMIIEAREMLGKHFPWKRVTTSGTKPKQVKKQQKLINEAEAQQQKPIFKEPAVSPLLANYQSYCKQTFKKILNTIPSESGNLLNIQVLQISNKILNQQIPLLKSKIKSLEQFIDQKQQVNENTPLSQIVYANGKDDMLLDLICQNKAFGEQLQVLERMFDRKKIEFDVLLKHVRRVEQSRFMVRYGIQYMMEAQLN